MPDEENEAETAQETDAAGSQGESVTDAELLAALGLNEQLEPISEVSQSQGQAKKAAPARTRAAGRPASGENTGDDDERDREDFEDEENVAEVPEVETEQEEEPLEEEERPQEEEEQEEQEEPEQRRGPPKGIAAMQKRIDKLTARNRDLETSLSRAQRVQLRPSARDPLADLDSEAEVRDYMDSQKRFRRWALENIEGGEILDEKGNPKELSGKEVRARLAHAEEVLQEYGPARVTYLREREKYEDLARKEYPALFENKSLEARMMANFLALCPEMLRVPNYQMIIGDAIRGMKVRMVVAQQKGTKGKASGGERKLPIAPEIAKVKLAPKAIRGGTAVQTRTKAAGAFSRLEREFLGSGDKNKLTALIASTL